MGQYGNQPEFATFVESIGTPFPKRKINNSAIYIGSLEAGFTEGSITVTPVGNNTSVTFTGIKAGTFLPVIVTKIDSSVGIPFSSVLLYN